MAVPISPNQSKFLSGLAQTTRYDPTVLAAWLRNEEPMTNQNTDPAGHGRFNFLNVGITDSKPYGAASSYWNTTPQAAGVATGKWLLGQLAIPGFGKSSAGIQGLAKFSGASPQAQIRAIQQSGWASGGETALPGLYQQFSGQKLNIPTTAAAVAAPGVTTRAATPASVRGANPLPTVAPAAPAPDYSILQMGLNSAASANQRAFSALGDISGVERRATPALDLTGLFTPSTPLTTQAPGVIVPIHPGAPTPKGLTTQGQKAVALAKQYLGTPYLWGGANPKSGFDCSGLISYVWAKNGVTLPHNAAAQFKLGTPVDTKHLQAGDGLYFSTGNGVTHAGMYIGNGQFIEAPHTGDHVKIAQLSGVYAQELVGARRFGGTPPPTSTTQPTAAPQMKSPSGNTIAHFEGTPVDAWMLPALQYARANGWKGTLTSGVRTTAEQKVLYARYRAGGNVAAKPGQSNHEVQNGGAFDATDAASLNKILQGYKGQRPIWAMTVGLNDTPHFSLNGH